MGWEKYSSDLKIVLMTDSFEDKFLNIISAVDFVQQSKEYQNFRRPSILSTTLHAVFLCLKLQSWNSSIKWLQSQLFIYIFLIFGSANQLTQSRCGLIPFFYQNLVGCSYPVEYSKSLKDTRWETQQPRKYRQFFLEQL